MNVPIYSKKKDQLIIRGFFLKLKKRKTSKWHSLKNDQSEAIVSGIFFCKTEKFLIYISNIPWKCFTLSSSCSWDTRINLENFGWKRNTVQLPSFLTFCDIPPKIYGPKVFLLTKINLSIPTSCTIRHISLVPWCVGLDRFHCMLLIMFDV
jgi:hypothetical protein